jgi:hypothetical protein
MAAGAKAAVDVVSDAVGFAHGRIKSVGERDID